MKKQYTFGLFWLLLTWISTAFTLNAQAYQQLLDACPGCNPNIPAVPPPTCVNCNSSSSQSSAPAVQSIDSYNADLSGVYAREGSQENEKGIAAYNNRDWDKAISHFKKALKFVPNNSVFQGNLNNAIAQRDHANNDVANQQAQAAAKAEYERKLAAYNKALAEKKEADRLFLENLNRDAATYDAQLRKLEQQVSYVPPLGPKKVIHEGIILGLKNTSELNSVKNIISPWSHQRIDSANIFATTDDVSNWELARGLLDNNYLGEYTLSTPYGQALIERLRGTHFDRLVAHSNGATIAEALIRKGIITVNELDVIGGDRSFVNVAGWNELISSGTVARVVVWVNPGDPVPFGTTVGPLVNAFSNKSEYAKNLAAYISDKVKGSKGGHDAEYRILRGEGFKGQDWQFNKKIFDAHDAGAYFFNLSNLFNAAPSRPR